MTTRTVESERHMYLINQVLMPDTKICRYIDFDVFLQILHGKFYIPRKQTFIDSRENGKIPNKCIFGFRIANRYEEDCKTDIVQDERSIYINNLMKSRLLLTSCWKIDDGEDYLMWKSYTTKMGVCVQTTIDKLMEAIDYDSMNMLPICSPMFYAPLNYHEGFMESMFKKESFYHSENEVRFYFVPKGKWSTEDIKKMDNKAVEQILLETSEKEEDLYQKNKESYKQSILLDVKPQFISSVVLSPFILNSSCQLIQNILFEQYKDIFISRNNIKESKITFN